MRPFESKRWQLFTDDACAFFSLTPFPCEGIAVRTVFLWCFRAPRPVKSSSPPFQPFSTLDNLHFLVFPYGRRASFDCPKLVFAAQFLVAIYFTPLFFGFDTLN